MSIGNLLYLIAVIIYGVFGFTAFGFSIAFWMQKAKYDYESKLCMITSIVLISVATPILIIGAVCGALL